MAKPCSLTDLKLPLPFIFSLTVAQFQLSVQFLRGEEKTEQCGGLARLPQGILYITCTITSLAL